MNQDNDQACRACHGPLVSSAAASAPVEVNIAKGEWLSVSTQGFAEQQLGRPLGHLVKELTQNALDSVAGSGRIDMLYRQTSDSTAILSCYDDGPGARDLSTLNIVFLTDKKDGVTQRGRMGRGFKELLSVAASASVRSHDQRLSFTRDQDGVRCVDLTRGLPHVDGFQVDMDIIHSEVATDLASYFRSFLVPAGVILKFNSQEIPHRPVHKVVDARLTTERFTGGRWNKPSLCTTINLVPVHEGEDPLIYEMGIPVCKVEWTEPFHCDVMQRVPMNPNRDAVMSSFPGRLHTACLPSLVREMSKERALSPWVGEAASGVHTHIQKEIVTKAFGKDIVRAVPTRGRFDNNADAEEMGNTVLHTAHMAGGFRDLVLRHVPTATVVARNAKARRDDIAIAAGLTVGSVREIGLKPSLSAPGTMAEAIGRIGRDIVLDRMACTQWLCEAIVACRRGTSRKVPVHVACMQDCVASWSISGVLTLNLLEDAFWIGPFGKVVFAVLVHELAHRDAFHHGVGFPREVEAYAGAAMETLMMRGAEAHALFPSIMTAPNPVPVSAISNAGAIVEPCPA